MIISKTVIGCVWLLFAIGCDVFSTFFSAKGNGLEDKLSQGIAFCLYIGSFVCCAIALKYIQTGILYVLWGGIGAVATIALAKWYLGQNIDVGAWVGVSFIVVGLIVISQFSDIEI